MYAKYGAITLCGRSFQSAPLYIISPRRSPTTPSRTRDGLASSAFARHYLRNHFCFLFLLLLRCFSSEGWLLLFTDLQSVGFPHSDTRGSIGRLHLPAHFRSLPRPSSPPGAKASPMRPYSLPTLCPKTNLRISKFLRPNSTVHPDRSLNDLYYYILPTLSMNFCRLHLGNINVSSELNFRQNSLESNQ